MNADEIRRRTKVLVDGATSTHKSELAAVELLGEIAAQLADLNEPRQTVTETLTLHKNPTDCPSVRRGLWTECQGHPA